MADTKPETFTSGAFASSVSHAQKYIVFNLEEVNNIIKMNKRGAENFLPYMASHEDFHTWDIRHPLATNGKELLNTRSWQQSLDDIFPPVSFRNILGYKDLAGQHTVSYSFVADPRQVPHGNPDAVKRMWNDPNGIPVESITNLTAGTDPELNKIKGAIKQVMLDTFRHHESLFDVKYIEAKDPNSANLLIYGAIIPSRPISQLAKDGRYNAYNQDVTILSYTPAEHGLFARSGVAEVAVMQKYFGPPKPDSKQRTITAEELGASSGVLWDDKPMAVDLTANPLGGELTVDMSAPPIKPAIVGTLVDQGGNLRVRHHVAKGASISELDATGTEIVLDVTGTDNAVVRVGYGSKIKLNGKNNQVTLGPGNDAITLANGSGHIISGLSVGDSIGAQGAAKAMLEYHNNGTLLTLISDSSKPTGSVLVKDMAPDQLVSHLKDITRLDAETEAKLAAALKKGVGEQLTSGTPTSIPFAIKGPQAQGK